MSTPSFVLMAVTLQLSRSTSWGLSLLRGASHVRQVGAVHVASGRCDSPRGGAEDRSLHSRGWRVSGHVQMLVRSQDSGDSRENEGGISILKS